MKTNQTLATKYRGRLRCMNTWVGVWHLILAISLVILVIAVGSPFALTLYRTEEVVDENLLPSVFRSAQCTDKATNVTTTYTNVFDYLRCVAPAQIAQKSVFVRVGSVKIWVLLLIFELVTALSHFRLVYFDQWYHRMLQINLNPARWREYSITNTLMLISILSLSGLSDLYLMLHIALGAIFMNYCGGLVYELLVAIETLYTLESPIKGLVREARIIILVLAWLALILSLVYLFDTFTATVNSYYALETGTLWQQLFQIIFILNIGITVCYSSFPVLHLLQNCTSISYFRVETWYIIASLVAKSFLTIIVMAATVQRS